jgi:hypothetical protein
MTDAEEWITVTEYASRRGISERQARRIAAALPDTDRTPPDVRPAKVRWRPAMSGAASEAEREAPRQSPADVRTTTDPHYEALTAALVALQQQLLAKDRQIEQLQAQVDNEQRLRILEATRATQGQIEPARRSWFQHLLAAWKDQRIDQ